MCEIEVLLAFVGPSALHIPYMSGAFVARAPFAYSCAKVWLDYARHLIYERRAHSFRQFDVTMRFVLHIWHCIHFRRALL